MKNKKSMKLLIAISYFLIGITDAYCCNYKGATIVHSPGTYSFSSLTTSAADEEFGPGTVTVTSNITVNGLLQFFGSTINETGNIIVSSCGTLIIQSNAVLNFNGTNRGIFVLPGGKLIINNSTVNMANQDYINVESNYIPYDLLGNPITPIAGGILNVSNSTIQGFSHSQWYGIGVAGGNGAKLTYYSGRLGPPPGTNSDYFSQYMSKGIVYVGQAILNSSTISDMLAGVANFDIWGQEYTQGATTYLGWFSDASGFYSGGGLIQANHCNFTNNGGAIYYEDYQNWLPYGSSWSYLYSSGAKLASDRGFVRNCSFYNTVGAGTTQYIYTQNTNGFSILGCSFDGSNHAPGVHIINEGSNLIIDQACNDPAGTVSASGGCSHIGYSNFINAQLAVWGVAGGSGIIENTSFQGFYGTLNNAISLNQFTSPAILNNTITLDEYSGVSPSTIVGIDLEGGGTGYWVEGNKLNINSKSTATMVGILVNASGANADQIYRNTIKNMDYGMQANGLDYDSKAPEKGLRFLCNDLATNSYPTATDILAGDAPGLTPSLSYGMATFQGDGASSPYTSAANKFSIGKSGPTAYNFYNQGAHITNYYWSSSPENPVVYDLTLSPIFTSVDNTCPDNTTCCGILYPKAMLGSAFVSYGTYLARKVALETTINQTTPGTQTYAYLLTAYAKLTDSIIRTFLYKGDSLHQYKGDSVFVQYSIDTAVDSQGHLVRYDTTTSYLDSAVIDNTDSIILVLDSTKYLYEYKIQLADIYARRNDYSNALYVLGNISSNFTLIAQQQRDLSNIIYLYGIRDSLYRFGRKYDSLSSTDTALVGHIARDSSGQARYVAQGILGEFNHINFLPDVTLLNGGPKNSNPAYPVVPSDSTLQIALLPNPAKTYINIDIQNCQSKVSVSIFDVRGSELLSRQLEANSLNNIDIQQLPEGTYFVSIYSNSKVIKCYKLIKE